jgi:uncharacterized protein DUF1553/uncharacterized protein DUF1549/cytochrome c
VPVLPALLLGAVLGSPTLEDANDFARLRTLLAERCFRCHGPDVQKKKLRLDRREDVLGQARGTSRGAPIVVPGDPAASELWLRVSSPDPEERMPPEEAGPALTADELARVRAWIEAGASWREHWALEPVRATDGEGAPPRLADEAWALGDVDRFVKAELEARGLAPAAEAGRATWLRRASFVLTGLPPSVTELEAFLADATPGAYERVVERLLASPHHAEAWARHWLDLVRYAETRGHEFDMPIPGAFEFRDWVVRAYDVDLPYDDFVREQIAGDLVDPPRREPEHGWNESVIGTGFWWLGEEVHSPVDLRKDQADRSANKIDVFGKAFLGLTVACARCHDHKFDPIPSQDFYALAGIAQSMSYREVRFEALEDERAIRAELERLRAGQGTHVRAELRALGLLVDPPEATVTLPPGTRVLADWREAENTALAQDGAAWVARRRGEVHFGPGVERPLARVLELGCASADPLWSGLRTAPAVVAPGTSLDWAPGGRTLCSPGFTLTSGKLWYLVQGKGTVFACLDGHRLVHGPLHGASILRLDTTRLEPGASGPGFTWVSQDLSAYAGHAVRVEFTPAGGGGAQPEAEPELSVAMVIEGETPPGYACAAPPPLALPPAGFEASAPLRAFFERQRALLARRTGLSRAAPAALEANGMDEQRYVRGNPAELAEAVPRRNLSALRSAMGSADEPGAGPATSGRLELAAATASPANPLTARVYVNRAWQHVFGRGLVATTDNFGTLGGAPTHPALLDWLARRFVKVHGWRLKPLLAELVLSRTFRLASQPVAESLALDPTDTWLHCYPVRRLEAEELRDALLAVSGRLDRCRGGPSVPVHLTSFMGGRGKPAASGPLDGDGRRSLYLEVRRNFPDPFLQVFDFPTPFTTIGRRSDSNVPAQALALMNDPFVWGQAEHWSARLASEVPDVEARLVRAHLEAFARRPEPDELALARAFLADFDAWPDYLHALLQTKEFRYVR